MGYKFYPTHTLLRKRIKQRMQRRVRDLCKKAVPDDEFKQKTASYFGWCKHANCLNLLRTTFNDKLTLYSKNMEFKRLSEIRDAENWFGLLITRSDVIRDRLERDKDVMPFIATIKKIKNYTAYE